MRQASPLWGSGLGRSTLVLEGSEMTLVGQGPRAVVLATHEPSGVRS